VFEPRARGTFARGAPCGQRRHHNGEHLHVSFPAMSSSWCPALHAAALQCLACCGAELETFQSNQEQSRAIKSVAAACRSSSAQRASSRRQPKCWRRASPTCVAACSMPTSATSLQVPGATCESLTTIVHSHAAANPALRCQFRPATVADCRALLQASYCLVQEAVCRIVIQK